MLPIYLYYTTSNPTDTVLNFSYTFYRKRVALLLWRNSRPYVAHMMLV